MHCPSCGEEVTNDSDYCRHCGEEIAESPVNNQNTDSSDDSMVDTSDESGSQIRTVGYWLGRLGQVGAVGAAFVFVAGAIMGGMSAYAFLVVGVTAIILLLFTVVLEFGVRAVS